MDVTSRLLRQDADNADLHALHVEHERVLEARQALAARIAQIGGEARELRFRHALAEHFGPEIELVVARHEGVGPHHVDELDDVGALVETGEQRWRDGVARMHEHDVRMRRALRLHDGGDAGIAAPPVAVRHLVDVVDEQEGDMDRLGESRPADGQQGKDDEPEPSAQFVA